MGIGQRPGSNRDQQDHDIFIVLALIVATMIIGVSVLVWVLR